MLYLVNYEVLTNPYIGQSIASLKGQVIVEADTDLEVRTAIECWLEEYEYFDKGYDHLTLNSTPMIKYSDYKEAEH